MEGWFRLWAEDPSAAPGRRFCAGRSINGRPAFDTRSSRAPYRSFSMKHNEETKHTYLALLATDGRLTVYENEQPESMTEFTSIDEFTICPKPARGEEVAFKVRFDPNPEPCYTALRAGVPTDALGLVVAGMDTVRVYRSREIVVASYGVDQGSKEFYLAAEVPGHRGLVRDVAWAPGNVRGYDVIATACQDGYARVFQLDAPFSPDDGKSWATADVLTREKHVSAREDGTPNTGAGDDEKTDSEKLHSSSHTSSLSASLAKSAAAASAAGSSSGITSGAGSTTGTIVPGERQWTGQPGQIRHTVKEISRLDNHRTPVWRVGFDDDGMVLGSTGDDGRLLCYRQRPDGGWAKSSEMSMMKTRMAAP